MSRKLFATSTTLRSFARLKRRGDRVYEFFTGRWNETACWCSPRRSSGWLLLTLLPPAPFVPSSGIKAVFALPLEPGCSTLSFVRPFFLGSSPWRVNSRRVSHSHRIKILSGMLVVGCLSVICWRVRLADAVGSDLWLEKNRLAQSSPSFSSLTSIRL